MYWVSLKCIRVLVVHACLNVVLGLRSGLEDGDEFVEATVHHVEPLTLLRLVQRCGQDGIRKLLTERVDCVAECVGCQKVLRLYAKLD